MTIRKISTTLLGAWLAFMVAGPGSTCAADNRQEGSIEGRVINPATGSYLTRARVTIPATGAEQFTDQFGQYRLANVPAGEATIQVFYTGLEIAQQSVTVAPGRTAHLDFNLES